MANEDQWKQGRDWGTKHPTGKPSVNAPQDWANGAKAGQSGGKK